MKIVRTLPLVCLVCLLSACADSVTGPEPVRAEPPPSVQNLGNGGFGSGN